MWMSNVPKEAVAQALDGGHRRLEPVDQAGPRLPDAVVDIHLGRAERRKRVAMRSEGPAHSPIRRRRPTIAARMSSPGSPAEGALVELVDLALDLLGEQEIADEDLVDEGRDQVAGRQGPRAGSRRRGRRRSARGPRPARGGR